ncbi:MAG: amino acid adenylation domain protein [Candidatus Sulfotelmatobacter sp.]|nr:amino acid adenylation domain protein [Candidatus Sulfotelmatobacter sp.]
MSEVLTEARRKQLLETYLQTRLETLEQPPEISRRERKAEIPLTFAQQQLWLHAQLAPNTALYNEPFTVRHRGRVDARALEHAFSEIVRRHEAWRTVFPVVGVEPVQRVRPPFPVELPEIDLRSLARSERDEQAVRIATADARLAFDLGEGPLFRAKLVRLDEEEYRLYVTVHHLIFDGFSGYRVFLPELVSLYAAFSQGQSSPLPDLPFQFGDYAFWQRERTRDSALESHMEYWRKQIGGPLPSLQLPMSGPAPAVQSFGGAMQTISLPPELSERLRELCRREGVTLFMALLAAFKVLLYRYTGVEDILVGSNTAGRGLPGSEKLLGYFLNTVPLRTDLSGDPTFLEVLDRVRGVTLGAFSHEEVPLDRLVAELQPERDPNRNPLFQVLFSLEPPPSQVSPEWDLTCIEVETGATKFELCMVLDDRPDGLLCRLIYNTALFDASVIRRMAGHWQTLLEAVAADPARQVSEFPILTPPERQQILVEWNDTELPYQPVPVHVMFEEQAREKSQSIALRCGDQELLYGELELRAARLAHRLQTMGVGPNVPVALCLNRSVEMVVGILAVLKAGGAYVPLDPANPRPRLELILEDCQPKVLLAQSNSLGMALSAEIPTVFMDRDLSEVNDAALAPGPKSADIENLAYILYTSGSTGAPKGVQVTHRNLANSTHARLHYYKDSPENFLLLSSYAFDSSVAGIFHTLGTGGTLVIPPAEFRWDRDQLRNLIFENKITHTLAVPSLYGEILGDGSADRLSSLRSVVVAGEACPRQLVNLHYEILPHASLFNEYGPTEATVWSTVFECEPGGGEGGVPIGRPIANTRAYVFDRHLEPVPMGVSGELYVGGEGIARGYLNQLTLTEKSFVRDHFSLAESKLYRTGDLARYLPSGDLEFLGRSDQQVKIRGLRVELDEIEMLLGQHPAVREACVVSRSQQSGDSMLVAFLVARSQESSSANGLRAFLRNRLPAYMVPAKFQFVDAFPRTSNGKIDRQQLALMEIPSAEPMAEICAPRNDFEQRLLVIWKDVLKVTSDDVSQDFFELGGHSLLAAKLLMRIEGEFHSTLSLAFVFQSPTIAQMAVALRVGRQTLRDRAIVPIQQKGPLPPLFWIRGGPRFRLLAEKLAGDRPFLGVDLPYSDGVHLPMPYRVEDIAAYLIKAIREVQPKGPYYLAGLCVNAVIAYEVAQQLVQQGDSVELLAMLDAHNHAYYKNPLKDGRYTARIKYHVTNLLRMDSSETSVYLRDRLDEARRKIERITWRLNADRKGHADDHFRNTDSIVHPAFSLYEPKPYPGKLVLLQSSEWPKSPYFDFKLGWEDLAGEIDFHRIAGDHAYLFDEPNVEAVARTLGAYLLPAHSSRFSKVM